MAPAGRWNCSPWQFVSQGYSLMMTFLFALTKRIIIPFVFTVLLDFAESFPAVSWNSVLQQETKM